jgi:hypothetical protein
VSLANFEVRKYDWCQYDNQQWPEVVDEIGLDRWRVAERDEQGEVVTEKAIYTERERRWRYSPNLQVEP